jgi:2,4-dienoyl-CoA reductase-like NADH-dependent reductase (Old Yellow Enzyme family)
VTAYPKLFSPFRCRGLELRNRVVMAPMTREWAPGGVPGREIADYYARRAAGGTALIITEGTPPDPAGAFGARVPRFYGEDALEGWRGVVDAVHGHGAAIFAQLWHVGAFDPSIIGMRDSFATPPERLSPSGLAGPGRPYGRAMTSADIEATIGAFGRAVAAARAAGFDGVEIHCAHGYLPDQFLWSGTNRREDRYGGSLERRLRFPVELVRECRRQAGEGLVLSFRLSQWKQLDHSARIAEDPTELGRIVQPLAGAGVDIFHCSTRRYRDPIFAGSDLGLAGWVKRLSGRPTIAVGSITLGNDFKSPQGKVQAEVDVAQLDDVERRLQAGEFDLVALGRALLANADWVHLVQRGLTQRLQPFSRACLDALF